MEYRETDFYNVIMPEQFGLSSMKGYRELMVMSHVREREPLLYYELPLPENIVHFMPCIPDGCMDILFAISEESVSVYLMGTIPSLSLMEVRHKKKLFGVRFQPGGFRDFFRIAASQVISNNISLSELSTTSEALCIDISRTNGFEERIAVMNRFLEDNFSDPHINRQFVTSAVKQIIQKKGAVRIAAVASEFGYSERYLNKVFHECIGLTPKQYAIVVQNNAALWHILQKERCRLTDIAYLHDYSDQSHLNRRLKQYVSVSPKQISAEYMAHHEPADLPLAYLL
jgi:AraC-like DNA-binding protein